ncbi:MAG TPA: replication initiator protein A [Trichococcus flocculiformis]|nr:replication initiator protein A [Trichococcus flocculiformis]
MLDYFYGQSGEMFSYFRVPKILFRDIKFKDLSTDAKTLYGILLDRMGLSVKNGWLDEQGRVYIIFPVQEVMDALCCADNKATKLFRELEKFGLIERKRRGLGKPNLIYVKNFADPRFRNRGKNDSGNADSEVQDAAKSRGNKTEWNKTEGSEPDPFSSDAEDEPDERTRLEAYFMQSLEVDLLLRACPDEEDTIHQIVNLLVDTCSSKRRMLRVAGDDKPAEVVRSRFMKLNVLERHCNQAKIPVISVHGLRHTHASVLLFAGVSIASVVRRLGHSSMTTTQKTYLHIIRELENQDIDLVMRSLSGLS